MTRRSDNGAVEKLSQFLTPQHLRQLKFAGVVTVMTLLCGIFLWYLFTPKPAPQQAGAGGYNVTIPEATVKPAETDKRKIYEQEQYEQQRREKLQSLGDVMDDRLPVTGESSRLFSESVIFLPLTCAPNIMIHCAPLSGLENIPRQILISTVRKRIHNPRHIHPKTLSTYAGSGTHPKNRCAPPVNNQKTAKVDRSLRE